MKRIISFALCLSMLLSMVPASVFAAEVEETAAAETFPVAETTQAPTEAPFTEATEPSEAAAAETAAAQAETAPETTAAAEVPEATEATVPRETEAEEIFWEYTYIPDDNFPDSDELFAVYAEQQFCGTEFAVFSTAAGERLTGDTKTYYDRLVPVLREIASGQRSSSQITVASVGFDFDVGALLSALLEDMPYELYWFDKVSGIYCMGNSREITFSFFVAGNYAVGGAVGTCNVDTAKTGAVITAVANAKAIVEENAHLSDYDKLLAYKNKICDLTSYNTAAAGSGNFSSDDDPWQLIYVFDGLQSTKVVCEGYAKAFQYLCDLSEFTRDITCYSVSGVMAGGAGAGAHMWNIVSINGKNYLADITNSDTGTVGANGKLFLAGKVPNDDGSYTIGGVRYIYNEETIYLWGTDADSILFLAEENYDPNSSQDPDNGITPPTSAEELLDVMNSGRNVTVQDAITVSDTMTLSSESQLSFAEDAELTIASGATLTLNCPTVFNGAQLIVEEGATLVSNGDIIINAPQHNSDIATFSRTGQENSGSAVVFNGNFENNGALWINTGSTADINGYVSSSGPIFVGFGGNSRLNINGQLDMTGYLCVNEGGTLNLPEGAKLNLLGIGGGYLDNQGFSFLGGEVYIEGLMSSGARRDEETDEAVGSEATIEIRGSVTATNTSLIAVGEGGSIACYGPVTTAGEVVVEPNGAFWVDHTVTLTDPGKLTVNGAMHIDFFDEFADANGLLNLETTANVNGYLHVADGGVLNVTDRAVLNIKNDEKGCGYLDNQGHMGLYGTMHLDGLFTTGAAIDDDGNPIAPADTELRGSINASDTSTIGIGMMGNLNCFGPMTTAGEVTIEPQGALWVDNTVSITGPGKLTADGALHVDYFDEFATEDGVLNVDTETHVNGYFAVHDGGRLHMGEHSTLGIHNNEKGCGYLDNQGTVVMDGHLYLEGLFTTGAACDENGNVVGKPASAVCNWYADITDTGSFGVLNGGTVTVMGVNNSGEFLVEEGGKLIFAEDASLENYGGLADTTPGTVESEGYYYVMNHLSDGAFGSVHGFPVEQTFLHCYPDSVADIRALVDEFETGMYVDGTIQIENDFVIDETISLPEGTAIMLIVTEGNGRPTLTIPEGVRVLNDGTIGVYDRTTLVVDGTIIGNQPENKGGTITGGFYEITMEELENWLSWGQEVVLTNDLVLTRDLTIPGYSSLRIVGAELIIPAGMEISNYGTLEVADQGRLTVNGGLTNYHTGGCLDILANGLVTVNGAVHNGTVTNVLGGSLVINGNWEGYGPIVADGGTVSGSGAPSSQDALELLLNSSAVNGYPVNLNSKMVLTRDLTIPAGACLTIGKGGQLIVPGGKALIVEGELHVTESVDKDWHGEPGLLVESGRLVNNGLIALHDLGYLDASNGIYEQADWAGLDLVFLGDDNDSNIPFVPSAFNGIPLHCATLIADYTNPQVIHEVLSMAEGAAKDNNPFRGVHISIGRDMTLSENLTIPENGDVRIENCTVTVPANVTLHNNGRIEIGWSGKLVIKNGAALEGNQPMVIHGGEFVDSAPYTENAFRADLELAAQNSKELFLSRNLTLTRDLTIPADAMLTIAHGGKLTVPAGVKLTVEGQLHVTWSIGPDGSSNPGLLVDGGKLVNNGSIVTRDYGRLDATNGTYEQADWAQLHRVYYSPDNGGDVFPSETFGISNHWVDLILNNVDGEVLPNLLAMADSQLNKGDSFRSVQINITDWERIQYVDLTIPAYAWMRVENGGTLIVPDGVTLTNRGSIDIHPSGTVIVEEGGAIVGNHPSCVAPGATYINHNTFEQAHLEELIAQGQANGTDCAVLGVPVTLERNLTIPAGFMLIISGADHFLTIPDSVTLTNRGKIVCDSLGGIQARGGTLRNAGDVHALYEGIVDMSQGVYEKVGEGMVYNSHISDPSGNIFHATVLVPPEHMTIVAETCSDDRVIREMIAYVDGMIADGNAPWGLSLSFADNAYLTDDLELPAYSTPVIPKMCTLTVPAGCTLYDNVGLLVEGQLIIEGNAVSMRWPMAAYDTDAIVNPTPDTRYIVFGTPIDDYTIGCSSTNASVLDGARLWIETVEPAYAEYCGEYDLEIIGGDGWIDGDWVRSRTPGTVTVAVKPIVGYDSQNNNKPIYAEHIETIDITFTQQSVGYFFSDSADFFENDGLSGYGLWAGNKAILYPVLMDAIGQVTGTDGITATYSEGYEQYATITANNGIYTVTALKTLATHEVISITFHADGIAPATVYFHLRPKAESADIRMDGKTVTGSTVTVDVNGTNPVRQLDSLIASADAVPVDGVLIEGVDASDKPMAQWSSSNTAVATVDENGTVTFTGVPGIVKITLTTSYGSNKTATVTFKAMDLPQYLRPSDSTVTKLIGGKSATYSVTDEEGNTLTAKEVQWFFVDEWGNLTDTCPYASINAKGKLTTKAVADPYKVRLQAAVTAIEGGAMLREPITVTLYPAVSSASIRMGDPEGYIANGQTLLLDTALYDSLPLYADVAPCTESVKSISWKSSKTTVAEINEKTGLLTLTGTGKTKITLTVEALDGKKTTATCEFNVGAFVRDITVTAMKDGKELDLEALVISGSEQITFSATTDPEEPTTAGVKWSIPASHKAYASFKGSVLTAAKNITNRVTVPVICESKDGNCSKTISVTILPKPVQVGEEVKEALLIQDDIGEYITKTTVTMAKGSNTWLYGSEDVKTWESNKPTIASIDDNGHLTAKSKGIANITATTDDGRTAEVTVKVVEKVADSIKINGEPFTVASGKSLALTAEITYNDKSVDKKGKVTWSVEENDCGVKITSGGKLSVPKGLTKTATVTVEAISKDGFASGSVDIEILPAATGLEVYGPFGTTSYDVDISNTTQKWDLTAQGNTFYLYAGVFPMDAMQKVTWKSSSAKVASVDTEGKVTCLKPGSATITATAADNSGKKASFKLTVVKTMTYLSLPEEAFIGSGKSLTMTKLDGFDMDNTASSKNLIWTLTDGFGNPIPKNVATLSTKGVLKANKKVASPVDVLVRAEAADGSGLMAECVVTIYPVTKGIALYAMDGMTDITGKAVSASIGAGCSILIDTTNKIGLGIRDDLTADEFLPNGSAWEITQSPALLDWEFDGQSIRFIPTSEAKAGDTVKITIKALDGSNKSAKLTVNIRPKTIGIALPNQSERWINDGTNMAAKLRDMGYEVILAYAQNNVATQMNQIETMITQGIDCLVLAYVDPYQMGDLLEEMEFADVPVIAYDRLPMNTDAVSYYTSFGYESAGRAAAEYIEAELDLANTSETYTIELFMGDPSDNNAVQLYNGAMKVIQKYLDNGTLVCKSGRTSFEDTCIRRWSQEAAYEICEDFLATYYSGGETLDICFTAFDGFAYACSDTMEAWGCSDENWPIITGMDAELMAVKNILSGKQSMTILKNTALLAEYTVDIVDEVVKNGTTTKVNDTTTYNNGMITVPACLLTPQVVTADNYEELLINSGYYTEKDIHG